MKALVIIGSIYLVSFLILFILWLIKRESPFDMKKWWHYLLFVIFMPLLAALVIVACLVMPFMKYKEKKEDANTPKPWYEVKGDGLPKEEKIAEDVFENDKLSMQKCDEAERNLITSMSRRCMSALQLICSAGKNIETTMEDHRLLEELNLIRSKKFGPIEAVQLPEGYTLWVDFACGDRYAKSTHFFVRDSEGLEDYKIYKYLKFEDSYKGAMAAYLIYSSWYNLRLCGHAVNLTRHYVFSDAESDIIPDSLSDLDKEMLMALLENRHLIPPQVYWKSGMAYVECTYWNFHHGLVRETLQIKFKDGYVREINELPDKVLYEYDCGIRFF